MSVANLLYQADLSGLTQMGITDPIAQARRATTGKRPMPGAFMFDSGRWSHFENFELLPRLAANLFDTNATPAEGEIERALLANRNWELAGSNAAQAQANVNYSGPLLRLVTAGASGDEMLLVPLAEASVKLDGTNAVTHSSRVAAALVGTTTMRPHYSSRIVTPATSASGAVSAGFIGGFKLTGTSVVATDNDQAFFRYETNGSGVGTWKAVVSIGGTDYDVDTGVAFAASTMFRLDICIDKRRTPHFFIDGRKVAVAHNSRQLASLTTLIPVHGAFTAANAAKRVDTAYIYVARDFDTWAQP